MYSLVFWNNPSEASALISSMNVLRVFNASICGEGEEAVFPLVFWNNPSEASALISSMNELRVFNASICGECEEAVFPMSNV